MKEYLAILCFLLYNKSIVSIHSAHINVVSCR